MGCQYMLSAFVCSYCMSAIMLQMVHTASHTVLCSAFIQMLWLLDCVQGVFYRLASAASLLTQYEFATTYAHSMYSMCSAEYSSYSIVQLRVRYSCIFQHLSAQTHTTMTCLHTHSKTQYTMWFKSAVAEPATFCLNRNRRR